MAGAALAAAALCTLVLTACGPDHATAPAAAPRPASCGAPCQAAGTAELGNGYRATLWRAPGAAPLVELLSDSLPVQWWTAPAGYSTDATLTCLPATRTGVANCVVISAVGAHAALAQLLLVQSGQLVAPVGGHASFDSFPAHAVDLDGDGTLDLVGLSSDYTPNYAQGHLFWHTELYRAGRGYVSSGCAPRTATVPSKPEAGTCPKL